MARNVARKMADHEVQKINGERHCTHKVCAAAERKRLGCGKGKFVAARAGSRMIIRLSLKYGIV
jgi:hypothetical protein